MCFRRLWSLRLRDQLVILVLLVLLPALALAVYSGVAQRQAGIEESKQHIVGLVRLFAHEQARLMDTTRHVLNTLAHIPEIRARDVAATDRILAELHGHMPFYTTLVAVNPSGEVFGCALPETKPINVADREWFAEVERTKAFTVGRLLVSRSAHKASLPMAFPVLNARGQVDFILGAALDLAYYGSVYAKISLPPDATLTLADAGGTVLFRNQGDADWVGKPLPEHLYAHINTAVDEGAFNAVSLGGVPRIYAYKHLAVGNGENKDWFMTAIVGIPEAQALEKPRRILVQHVGGLILMAALALAGAWLFARRAILDPLTALTQAAERVKDGDSTARTGIRIGGEIGVLARDFDDMAEALARRERERDAAKKELERQYAFVSTLVEAAPIPIYHKDRLGRFVSCNRAFAEFAGKDAAAIIGHTCFEIFPPEVAAQNTANDEELMLRGERLGYEAAAWSASGGERQVIFHKAAYRDDTGQVAGLVGILVDITPLKTAQAELVAAKEKAEEASRIKSDFLASMSHEIRTPLNGVLGMLQILLTEVVEPRHREYLDAAMGAARTLLQVIGEVLDFSKIEAGRLELSVKDFRPAALIESVQGLFGVQTESRGLTLSCELSPDMPPWVRGDEQRLKQILFNLVGNALKFTDTGGVRVRLARVAAEEAPDETVLDLIVEDTGVGIASEAQARIFEPFRQAGDSFERRSQGTGLGLVIVRRLAEAMGGFVHLYSREGEGTRFTVRVRLGRSAVTDPEPQVATAQDGAVGPGDGRRPLPAMAPSGGADADQESAGEREKDVAFDVAGLRVLVVEDDHLNRLTAVKLLERLGCVPEGVPGGEEALSLLGHKTFDAVLMDIQMPGMDGMETTRRIRNFGRAEVSGLFVAAVTAHALKGDREVFLRAGMDDYISKPVDVDELSAMLIRAMRRRASA
ncbi:ATP-binding protein [Desulfolutivibrio sp.]|uniref:ATP-binding protein n=1 Tax=Desulfolutivibrio sp. TaxID=2773296 RepID=UPI002F960D5B